VVTALDGTYGAGVAFNWTINDPITITDPGEQDFSAGESVNLQIHASDSHSGSLSYSAIDLPTGLTINASTGTISGTISNSPGIVDALVKVTDGISSAVRRVIWYIATQTLGLVTTAVQPTAKKAAAIVIPVSVRVLDGANDTSADDLKAANAIWKEYGIQFKEVENVKWTKAKSEAALGKFVRVDLSTEALEANKWSPSERKLYSGDDQTGMIYIYYVRAIVQPGIVPGGIPRIWDGWTDDVTHNHISLGIINKKGFFPKVLPHEFGHALGLGHVEDPNDLMYQFGSSRKGNNLTPMQVSTALEYAMIYAGQKGGSWSHPNPNLYRPPMAP